MPTVYVVDDAPEVRESLRLLLLSERLRVETYASAQAFLQDRQPARRGCLVLDLRMPGMSGLQLLDALSARHTTLPTIMITASADVQAEKQARQAGVVDFLRKPYHPRELFQRIRTILDGAR